MLCPDPESNGDPLLLIQLGDHNAQLQSTCYRALSHVLHPSSSCQLHAWCTNVGHSIWIVYKYCSSPCFADSCRSRCHRTPNKMIPHRYDISLLCSRPRRRESAELAQYIKADSCAEIKARQKCVVERSGGRSGYCSALAELSSSTQRS